MIPRILHIALLLSLSQYSLSLSSTNSSTYVAGVVEYHPITGGEDAKTIADANVNNLLRIMEMAQRYAVDIIVFPEYGLTNIPALHSSGKPFNDTQFRKFYEGIASQIPSPAENVSICQSTSPKYSEVLKRISCGAAEFEMYLVANLYERVDCPSRNCSSDGFLLYNTNVVFDRKGTLIARYRKYNLLHEPATNTTSEPEMSTFTTDFGVTFGQLICFDLLNESPAKFFVKNPNVTDVVYSTRLPGDSPFLDSTQAQAAWSYAADVNLLASGYNGDYRGSGGSGVYAGKYGPIGMYHPGVPSNALVVAEVPKMDRRNRIDPTHLKKPSIHVFQQADVPTISSLESRLPVLTSNHSLEDLRAYTNLEFDPSEGSHITTLCDRGLCCEFHVETTHDKELASSSSTYYRYRFVAFNGVRPYHGGKSLGVEVCAVIACTGDEMETCGHRFPDDAKLVRPTYFDSLMVTRRADLSTRSFYSPTVSNGYGPIDSRDFNFMVSGPHNDSLLIAFLNAPKNNLTTFGIYGRRFDRDGQEVTKPSSAGKAVPSVVAMVLLVVIAQCWFDQAQ